MSTAGAEIRRPALTCWPVLTEAAYLLRLSTRALSILFSLCDGADVRLLPLSESDLPMILAILDRYEDQGFDFADAVLMHLTEREQISHYWRSDLACDVVAAAGSDRTRGLV